MANVSLIPSEVLVAQENGFLLFPVKNGAKLPLVKWSQVASCDLSQLAEWSLRYPECNWGVVTGRRSGIFVVDVDGDRGRQSLSGLCPTGLEWPKTLQVLTARGFHSYFRLPASPSVSTSAGNLGAGLDVRGEGGFVVCPPSVHGSGALYEYENANAPVAVAPEWLLSRLGRPKEGQPKFYKGNRNEMLTRIGGGLRRKGASRQVLEVALLAENRNRCVPNLPVANVQGIALSLCRYEAGGPDVLASAWAKVQAADFNSTYEKVLALFRQLQSDLPGRPVALPLQRIASHFECDWSLIRRYRARALREGHIRLVKAYVFSDRKASLYEVYH